MTWTAARWKRRVPTVRADQSIRFEAEDFVAGSPGYWPSSNSTYRLVPVGDNANSCAIEAHGVSCPYSSTGAFAFHLQTSGGSEVAWTTVFPIAEWAVQIAAFANSLTTTTSLTTEMKVWYSASASTADGACCAMATNTRYLAAKRSQSLGWQSANGSGALTTGQRFRITSACDSALTLYGYHDAAAVITAAATGTHTPYYTTQQSFSPTYPPTCFRIGWKFDGWFERVVLHPFMPASLAALHAEL